MSDTELPTYRLNAAVRRDAIETIRKVAKAEKRSLASQCAVVLEEYAAEKAAAPAQAV